MPKNITKATAAHSSATGTATSKATRANTKAGGTSARGNGRAPTDRTADKRLAAKKARTLRAFQMAYDDYHNRKTS